MGNSAEQTPEDGEKKLIVIVLAEKRNHMMATYMGENQ